MRPLGIPTVADRIAQMVVKEQLEPELEKQFHPDSYGYRPNKSALEAVGQARKRCWKSDWVLDLDIKGFFDNIDHELMMKAVRAGIIYDLIGCGNDGSLHRVITSPLRLAKTARREYTAEKTASIWANVSGKVPPQFLATYPRPTEEHPASRLATSADPG